MSAAHSLHGRIHLTAIALACAALHLGGAVHHLLVAHVPCPEHGELVHGVAPAEHHAPSSSRGPSVQRSDADAASEHEHCPAATRPKSSVSVLVGAELARSTSSPGEPAPRESVFLQLSQLARAPKTSPPA